MLVNSKRLVVLYGRLLSLKIGECALIRQGRRMTRTGAVVSIQAETRGYVQFETRAARYCVVPASDQACAVNFSELLMHTHAARTGSFTACA